MAIAGQLTTLRFILLNFNLFLGVSLIRSEYSSIQNLITAFSVPISLEEIERIGEREGWRVFPANQDGLFDVVEFWVENRLMLQLLTPAIVQKYLNLFSPESIEKFAQEFTTAEARR